MIVRARNYNPGKEGAERTFLTAAIAAAATSSPVQSNNRFATNDFVQIGEQGQEFCEIIKLSGVSGNQTLSHSTTTPKFPHSAQTPLYQLKWDKIEFWRATSKTGVYSLQTTLDMDVDSNETIYDDTTGAATDWGKIRFKNSHSTTYSDYSEPFPYAGFTPYAAMWLIDEVKEIFNVVDPQGRFYDREKILRFLNEGVDQTQLELLKYGQGEWLGQEMSPAMDLENGTNNYDFLTNDVRLRPIIAAVHIKYSSGGEFTDAKKYTGAGIPKPDERFSESYPKWKQIGNKLYVYPTPSADVTGGLKVFAARVPLIMEDETAEPDLPRGMGFVLVPFALKRLNQMRDRGNKALDYDREWKEGIERVISAYSTDNSGEPRYVRVIDDERGYEY